MEEFGPPIIVPISFIGSEARVDTRMHRGEGLNQRPLVAEEIFLNAVIEPLFWMKGEGGQPLVLRQRRDGTDDHLGGIKPPGQGRAGMSKARKAGPHALIEQFAGPRDILFIAFQADLWRLEQVVILAEGSRLAPSEFDDVPCWHLEHHVRSRLPRVAEIDHCTVGEALPR